MMVQTRSLEQFTLYDLEQQFELVEAKEADFFLEWQEELPTLTTTERERLARVESAYANLERRSLLETTVKLAIVAPLLDLAGLFLPPFYVTTEKIVEIVAETDALTLKGGLDILALQGNPRYGRSNEFILTQNNGLAKTLQIIKRIAELAAAT